MKTILKILIMVLVLLFSVGGTHASDFPTIKQDFVDYFGYERVNSLQQKISTISQSNLKSIKKTLETDYLPKVESGEYSHKFGIAVKYIYFKIQDIYVDPNETDLEMIESKRTLVRKIGNDNTDVYFFTQIDRWIENTTACGDPYSGSHTCYIYVEKDGDIKYVGKMRYGVGTRTEILFRDNIISFDTGFADALTSIEYEVSLNITNGEIIVNETRTNYDPDDGTQMIKETNTREILENKKLKTNPTPPYVPKSKPKTIVPRVRRKSTGFLERKGDL